MPKPRSLAEISDLDGVAQGEAVALLKQLSSTGDPMKTLMVATHMLALHMAVAKLGGVEATELFYLTMRKLTSQYLAYREQFHEKTHGPN